jgi:membrane-bound lytic murein transglycosylase D
MVRMTLSDSVRTVALVVACAPLVLLAGCPQDHTASPGNAASAATAPAITQSSTAAPSKSPQAAPSTEQTIDNSARAFKVQQLINSAEAAYRSGVDNYRGGRLDAARIDFDSAVDLMLTSGMDLKTDPQLADEFDHLLNAVNSLEMAALKQGNGFSPKIEEAPLDTAEDLTFPANPELTAKLKAELQTASDLPLVINDQVAGYIAYFANSPSFHAHMLASMERAGKYKTMIQRALTDQGVPQDLIYLAVAESGFQPQALNSRSGAGGMWQFMPTGAYGLARNGFFDERFDPEKSSIAYARYMKTLYNQFGDWYLAMAAYDWGPGNVQRAVQRTGYADFWELYRRNALPKETRDYVPKILAAVIMAKNPEKYGLDKMVPNEPVVSDTVSVDYAIDLRLVADVTNSSLPEIVALNPSLLRMTTPGDMPFDLHIPLGTRDVFTERLKEIPQDKRNTWRFHVVRSGESLDGIVSSLHARTSDVVTANGLSPTDDVDTGDELVIPVTVAASTRPQRYTARRGDTLVTVSDRFGVSVEELRRWNHLSSSAVRLGASLAVSEPVKLAPGTHVRGKGARRKRGAHTLSTSVHQGSAHPSHGRTSSKTSAAPTTSKTAGKKTSGAAKPASITKTKKKATR